MQVLATMCEELPPDGLLLIYLSASGIAFALNIFSPLNMRLFILLQMSYGFNTVQIASGSNISGSPNHSPAQGKGDSLSYRTGGGLHIGARGNGGILLIHSYILY